MDILIRVRKNVGMLAVVSVLVIISGGIGAYTGVALYKDRLVVVSAGLWGKGVSSTNKGDYDHALFYFSQAIALNKAEPLFYHSMAETYEAKQNNVMALEFYKLALEQYKSKKTGPIESIEYKVNSLQSKEGSQ